MIVVGALAHQDAADLGGAGEGDLAHDRVGRHLAADGAGVAGHDVEDALGNAGALARARRARAPRTASGSAGLSTMVQPAASAGPALRVIMALGKFHGVIAATTPIGCLITTMRLSDAGAGDHVAVDALAFLGEPFDERRAVDDLAARFGERLALLGGEDRGEVVGVGDHQVEPLAQQRRALLGEQPAPGGQRRFGRVDRAPGLGRTHVGRGGHARTIGGVVDVEALAAIGLDPRAVDVSRLAQQGGILEGGGRRAVPNDGVHGSSVRKNRGKRQLYRCIIATFPREAAPCDAPFSFPRSSSSPPLSASRRRPCAGRARATTSPPTRWRRTSCSPTRSTATCTNPW